MAFFLKIRERSLFLLYRSSPGRFAPHVNLMRIYRKVEGTTVEGVEPQIHDNKKWPLSYYS
jgi:hypothetical protein